MTFREIDQSLLALVDSETGEILDYEAFEALQLERSQKAENMALWVLDLQDETEAIQREIKRLQDRKKSDERKIESLKQYLQLVLSGEKLKTDTLTISFRKSEAVELNDEAVIQWAESTGRSAQLLKYRDPDVSKTAVKELLKSGVEVPGATLVNNTSTIIK